MNSRLVVIAAMAMIVSSSVQARTDEREKVEILYETTLNLIHLLVEQGVIKQEVADEMIKKAEQKAAKKGSEERSQEKASEPKKGEVRVTYVPEHIKKEIRDQLRQEVVGQAKQERWGDVNAVPEWVNRFTMEGDVRLREQADFYGDTNAPAANFQAIGQAVTNTTDDSLHRERVRMRLGINANITRGVDLGLRLTTGNINDPVTTGELLGPPPISIG
ncbi:MAG: putative porin, partial [Pseudomonadota bacterium]|nr:putative porin [Pseudomonadota bacterium]